MTTKRLNELKTKFENNEAGTQELGEILTDFYLAVSKTLNEVKETLKDLRENDHITYAELQKIKDLMNPVYTIINSD
jgi:hypothetical protein